MEPGFEWKWRCSWEASQDKSCTLPLSNQPLSISLYPETTSKPTGHTSRSYLLIQSCRRLVESDLNLDLHRNLDIQEQRELLVRWAKMEVKLVEGKLKKRNTLGENWQINLTSVTLFG